MTADLDRGLHTALDAEVADVVAGDELWDRIQASVTAAPAARRPSGWARGYLLAAAAAAVVAAAAAALAWQHDRGPGVVTNPGPSPATATTAAPTTTPAIAVAPPPTTPREPRSGASPAPSEALAVLRDGRVVRLDLARQTIGAPLGVVGSPDDAPLPEERNANVISAIDVSPDARTVLFASCCEPAAGAIYRVPLAGFSVSSSPTAYWGSGDALSISPDGRRVVSAYEDIVVSTPDGAEVARLPRQGGRSPEALWWSPDGTRVAVRYNDEPASQQPRHSIDLLRWDGHALSAVPGSSPVEGTAVRWDARGELVVLPGRPLESRSTADGRWTLVIDEGGALHRLGPDGADTPLFPGVRFQQAEPIDPGAAS